MSIPTALSLVALSLEIACAAVMFVIARAPGWSRVRLLGFIALSAGIYSSVNLLATLLSNEAPLLRWIFEINLFSATLHACMWIWFTFADSNGAWSTVPRGIRWLGLFTLGCAAAIGVTGSVTDIDSAFPVAPGLRGIPTIGFQLTPIANVVVVLILLILAVCGAEYLKRARQGIRGSVGILIGFVLFGVFILQEALVAAGVVEFYFLSDLGYLCIVIPLGGQLLGRFSEDARRLAQLSADLATEVEQRTSERDAARESLVEQERLAALGRLAAGVGHEINNPLQYLLSNIEELEQAQTPDDQPWRRTALANALEGAERIRRVVEGLRRYGAVSEQFEPIDLHEVVQAAVRIAEPQLRDVARVSTALEPVPMVLGDEGQLVQCVVNVLANAAQAISRAELCDNAHITITADTSANGDASIRIHDNGDGFPDELLPRLGEPYVSTRAREGGTGLGIFVTHGLVAAHGGTLSLRNASEGGALVEIFLPPAQVARVAPGPAEKQEVPLRRARRILLVDDEPSLLAVLERGLSRLGHSVTAACNGAEALRLVDAEPFDLVLSDLMMPNMSGVDLAAALAENNPALRKHLLIMTGGAVSEDHAAFLDRGDVIVIEKPIRLSRLASIIDEIA